MGSSPADIATADCPASTRTGFIPPAMETGCSTVAVKVPGSPVMSTGILAGMSPDEVVADGEKFSPLKAASEEGAAVEGEAKRCSCRRCSCRR